MLRPGRLLAGVIGVLGLPALAGALLPELVRRHPVPAVLIALAWEGLLGAGLLVAKMMANPADRHLRQWGELLDGWMSRKLSRYQRNYLEWVAASLTFVDTKGLPTVGEFSPELDQVFVDVSLAPRAPHQVGSDLLADAPMDVTTRRSIWEFLGGAEPERLAVLGAPGSGKTTLLNHVARTIAGHGRQHRRRIPVLLQLRTYGHLVVNRPGLNLADVIREAVTARSIAEPSGWWESRLVRGSCVVLLDGLDEVADGGDRRAITGWIDRQIALYPRNDYVITSRPHGYLDSMMNATRSLQVRPFTLAQVRKFLHGWYLATERKATGLAGPEVALSAAAAADDLLERLTATPALYDLAVNPLLLTMIAHVHRYRSTLPGSRADLYGEVCQVMLWRRQERKNIPGELSGVNKENLLAWLAYTMMTERRQGLRRPQMLDNFRPGLDRLATRMTAEDFLADVCSNGMLVQRGNDVFEFAHLTFQEYLTARYVRDHNLIDVLVRAVDDPWWREVTLLYLAGTDADPIVQAGLRSGSTAALSLAFECAEADAELDPELRGRLARVMAGAFEEKAPVEGRRLAAGVLANRQLRHLTATPGGTRVCTDPVRTSLYWLFLTETGRPRPDGPCPATPDVATPVTGLWAADALAFVAWLNSLANGTDGAGPTLYRLPTAAELTDLSGVKAPSANRAWTAAGGTVRPVLWTHPGGTAGHRVGFADLSNGAAADVAASDLIAHLLDRMASDAARDLARSAPDLPARAETLSRLLSAFRSGAQSFHPETDMRSAPRLTQELSTRLEHASAALTRLIQAVQQTPAIDRRLAQALERLLTGVHIDDVIDDLDAAAAREWDVSMMMDWSQGLGLHATVRVAREVRGRIGLALEALGGRPRRAAEMSPLAVALGLDLAKPAHLTDTGTALAQVAEAVAFPPKNADRRRRFVDTLVGYARPNLDEVMTVDLDRAAGTIQWMARRPAPPAADWYFTVQSRLAGTASPIFQRRTGLTAPGAGTIRVPALVLAAEAQLAQDTTLATRLCEVAAAVTLMEQRSRRPELLESLILAYA